MKPIYVNEGNLHLVDYTSSVTIIDMMGRIILNKINSDNIIDLTGFNPGFYIVNAIKNDGEAVQLKFIK
jgi:hypothetical protein